MLCLQRRNLLASVAYVIEPCLVDKYTPKIYQVLLTVMPQHSPGIAWVSQWNVTFPLRIPLRSRKHISPNRFLSSMSVKSKHPCQRVQTPQHQPEFQTTDNTSPCMPISITDIDPFPPSPYAYDAAETESTFSKSHDNKIDQAVRICKPLRSLLTFVP